MNLTGTEHLAQVAHDATPTILIADDVPENIMALADMLGDDYRIVVATSGAEVFELLHTTLPDLILLDVMMPVMDGYEVCRRLKANIGTRDIPVIFVSGLGQAHSETHGLELGAVDYLHKPCAPALVRLRVRMHLQARNQRLALEHLVRERTAELENSHTEIVRCLGRAASYKDNETGMHVVRMGKASRLLALAAGLSEAHAQLLLLAAPMHDIGKVGIPDAILNKPGPLDAAEWQHMQQHPRIGAEIIGDHTSALMKMARSVALTHHEKWDGSGYPHGLRGEDIPLEGRIVAIADVFDALTSKRPYKAAWSDEAAMDYLNAQAGSAFDPTLVALFTTLKPALQAIRQLHQD
ncbi:MAG: response regulator [Rhodoferax sp.]|nr:response regulator [Rhodoferax sp.]